MQQNNRDSQGISLSAFLKETLGNGNRFCVVDTPQRHGVYDTEQVCAASAQTLTEQIDALMDAGQMLKDGRTSYVCSMHWNKQEYVVKRYNPKGFLHSLRHTLKRSRARRSWLNAHRLLHLGIPTPKPIGFIEERVGPLVKQSWLITELAPGQKLFNFLADPTTKKHEKVAVMDKVFNILTLLDRNRITHGDLKHVNLIVTPQGPTLIDLDSLKVHRTGLFYLYHRKKDLNAFSFDTPSLTD